MLRLEISGVNAPVDDKLKRYIRRKIGGVGRYVPRRVRQPAWAEVKLRETGAKNHNDCNCEVILHLPDAPIVVCETTVNMYAAVDIAEAQLKHRLRKYKELHAPAAMRRRMFRRQKRAAQDAES